MISSLRQPKKSKKLKVPRRNSSEVDSSSKGNSKKKKDKRKSPKTPIIDDDDDDARDLEVNIKPLSSYVNNREDLHRQLFTIISKKELKRMLPGILKVSYTEDGLRVSLHDETIVCASTEILPWMLTAKGSCVILIRSHHFKAHVSFRNSWIVLEIVNKKSFIKLLL